MENILRANIWTRFFNREELITPVNNLAQANLNVEYTIQKIDTFDEELKQFLFSLGCYEGEKITVISTLSENYVISVKDARYSIDQELAEAIII